MKRKGLIIGLGVAGMAAVGLAMSRKAHAAPTGKGTGAQTGDEQDKKAGQGLGAPTTAGPLPPGSQDPTFLDQFTATLARTALMAMGYAIDPEFESGADAGEIRTFAAGYNLVSKYGGSDIELLASDGSTVIANYRIPTGMGFVNVDGALTDAKRAAAHTGFLVSLGALGDPAAAAAYMADLTAFVQGQSEILLDTDWKAIVLAVFLREQVAAGVYDSIEQAYQLYNPAG